MKVDPDDLGLQEKEKDIKIAMFTKKLEKIRSAALWLDHVT